MQKADVAVDGSRGRPRAGIPATNPESLPLPGPARVRRIFRLNARDRRRLQHIPQFLPSPGGGGMLVNGLETDRSGRQSGSGHLLRNALGSPEPENTTRFEYRPSAS